jgi:hypothetical protein
MPYSGLAGLAGVLYQTGPSRSRNWPAPFALDFGRNSGHWPASMRAARMPK